MHTLHLSAPYIALDFRKLVKSWKCSVREQPPTRWWRHLVSERRARERPLSVPTCPGFVRPHQVYYWTYLGVPAQWRRWLHLPLPSSWPKDTQTQATARVVQKDAGQVCVRAHRPWLQGVLSVCSGEIDQSCLDFFLALMHCAWFLVFTALVLSELSTKSSELKCTLFKTCSFRNRSSKKLEMVP